MRGRWQGVGAAVALLCATSLALAEAGDLGGTGAALSERDGSVRARVGLRLAVEHAPNPAGDHAVAIGRRVQANLARLRACYQAALRRDATLQGSLVARLQHVRRGKQKVLIERNDTQNEGFGRCVQRALGGVPLRGLPLGSAAHVELRVSAPAARLEGEMQRRAARAQHVSVRRDRSGQLQSAGQTQGGEVQFSLRAAPPERDTLVALHQDVSERLAGLLDCRRRASRRGVPKGDMVFDVQAEPGGIERVRTVKNPTRDPRASKCVEAWLRRAESAALPSGQVRLTLRYGP